MALTLTGQNSGVSPDAGLFAGMTLQSPMMRQPPMRPMREAPGARGPLIGEQFYDALQNEDPKAIGQLKELFKQVREASLEGREQLERDWWQKLLYINGRQWIYYSARGGWQDKRFAKWIPRPVTNICAETVQVVRAMLSGIEPSLRVRPNGSEPIDVITAQLADQLEPVLYEEHRMQRRFFEADFWAPALGTVYLHPHWDRDDDTHKVFVQALMCPQCGPEPPMGLTVHPLDVEEGAFPGCPNCGTPAQGFVPAEDANGPIGQEESIGTGMTDVVSELELLYPTYFQRWEDVDRLIRLRWRPKTYYQGRPYESRVRMSSATAERTLQMYRSLAVMTDLTTAPYSAGGTAPTRVEGAIEGELWIKPQPAYPRGLWARAVGGINGDTVILYDRDRGIVPGPIPFIDRQDRPLWCWIYYPYEEVGGRVHGRSALAPIIQKQDSLNRNDSMVELIMQRMANPIWLEPKGAEVQRFTGEPGLIVRYQIVAGTQAKPERIEGASPGQAFFTLRAQHLSDAERLAGTSDPLKGSAPSGVEAFSALNLLVERSQSRFTSLFKARGRAYRDWFAVAIELERSYGPMQRTKSVMGPNNVWTFEQFNRQDLSGSITVIVEDGSEQPKTSLGKRAAIQHAQTLGVLNTSDPDVQYKTLEILGLPEIAPTLDAQTKSAQMEHEQYEQWVRGGRKNGPNPLHVRATNNHAIHIQQLDLWANSDKIISLMQTDPMAEQEITLHRVEHVVASMNPFGLPIPAAMPPPGPGGPPAGPGGAPAPGPQPQGAGMAMMNSNQESNAVDTLPGEAPGGGNMTSAA